MPSLDTYGDLSFDDPDGMQAFLQAHAARHSSYQQAALRQGLSFANTNLTEYPDDDWFSRHFTVHIQLTTLVVPDPTINITTLVDYDWSDANSFYTWMQMHTLVHQKLDEYFGNTG